MVTVDLVALLELLGTAHVDADRGIELQRTAAGGSLGVAVHDAYLLAELVDEDDHGLALGDDGRELTHGLGHEAGLHTHGSGTHVALDLLTGHQSGHRVHHHHVHGPRAHQRLADGQSILAAVGLGDQQVVNVHAQSLGIDGIQGMLGINEGGLTAGLLYLGGDVKSHGGLTRGLRPKDLNDTAAGNAADTQSHVQSQRARVDGLYRHAGIVAQLHDGALAEVLLDLLHGGLEGLALLLAVCVIGDKGGDGLLGFGCHSSSSVSAVPVSDGGLFHWHYYTPCRGICQ